MNPSSRRGFLSSLGVTAASAASLGESPEARVGSIGRLTPEQRAEQAFRRRREAALSHRYLPLIEHRVNGDTDTYPNQIASFSKGLPHNQLGEVDLNAYNVYLQAVASGDPADFERIPLGASVRLVNPQAAYAFHLEGHDPHQVDMPPCPAFASAEAAAEMIEVYWQALMRDVPFADFDSVPIAAQAAADLSRASDFRGPKRNRAVTPETLFRGDTPGDLNGPYVSQFLYLPAPYGALSMEQRYRVPLAGSDYMTVYSEWLGIQRGFPPTQTVPIDSVPRYIRNGRDLGEYVHLDFSIQPVLNACLILLSYGRDALSAGNPYKNSVTQNGFGTFGA
ncbi:MAG: phosphoesterase, partial [Bryobacteraceae bacterium]